MAKKVEKIDIGFSDLYATDQAKIKFSATFDLVNLISASKSGNCRLGKNPTKDQVIEKIIQYDCNHRNLISNQLYHFGPSYSKEASRDGIKEQIADLQREN